MLYHIHENLPLVYILSHWIQPTSLFISVRSSLILSSHQCIGLQSGLFWLYVDACMHFSPMYATCCAHPMLLYLILPVIFGEEDNHEAPHYVVFSTHILLSVWNTLSLCFFLNVSIMSTHPYTTTGRITILHFLILPFWKRKWKTKYSGFNAEKHFLNLMYLIS